MNLPIKPKYQFTEEIVRFWIFLNGGMIAVPANSYSVQKTLTEQWFYDEENKYKKQNPNHDSVIILNNADIELMIKKIDGYLDCAEEFAGFYDFKKASTPKEFVNEVRKLSLFLTKKLTSIDQHLKIDIGNKSLDKKTLERYKKINNQIEALDSLLVYLNGCFFNNAMERNVSKISFSSKSETMLALKEFLEMSLQPLNLPNEPIIESEDFDDIEEIAD